MIEILIECTEKCWQGWLIEYNNADEDVDSIKIPKC